MSHFGVHIKFNLQKWFYIPKKDIKCILKAVINFYCFDAWKLLFVFDPNAPVSQGLFLFVVPGQNVKLKTKKNNEKKL